MALSKFIDVCTTKLSCQNGGYTDPKNCLSCRCPDGWGGVLCDQIASGSKGIKHRYTSLSIKYSTSMLTLSSRALTLFEIFKPGNNSKLLYRNLLRLYSTICCHNSDKYYKVCTKCELH